MAAKLLGKASKREETDSDLSDSACIFDRHFQAPICAFPSAAAAFDIESHMCNVGHTTF